MRLMTNEGDYIYVEENGFLLQEVNDKSYLVGDTPLYGITDYGDRIRLTPEVSDTSNLYNLEYFIETTEEGDIWSQSSEYIDWTSVPPSLRSDDTYNFRNYNIELISTTLLAVVIIFCIFKRRWSYMIEYFVNTGLLQTLMCLSLYCILRSVPNRTQYITKSITINHAP